MKVVAYLGMAAELVWFLRLMWKERLMWKKLLFPRKITVISYASIPLAYTDYKHKPVRTRCLGQTPEGQLIPKNTDDGAFLVHVTDEGITWCWGRKKEDVDALVVAYELR